MKTVRCNTFLALCLAGFFSAAQTGFASVVAEKQAEALQTTGTVQFELATGRVEGKVCVSHRPTEAFDAFSLNAGLNVGRMTDGDGKPLDFDGWYGPKIDGEARVYILSHPSATVCVNYVGAFPLYPAHDAPMDFKGLIAFNGDSVRASEQSVWLPTPYSLATKTRFGDTAYDLTLTCSGCRFVYMNGSALEEQPSAHFVSAVARTPLFFGGTGPVTRTKAVTILNETVQGDDAAALSTAFQQIESYYNDYMGRPVTDMPVLLRITALDQAERDRRGSTWGFASWPTIALSGSISKTGARLLPSPPRTHSPIALLSHETGHYYFGTVMRPHGPYTWFLLESTAEFLSMKAVGAIEGPAAAQKDVDSWLPGPGKEASTQVALDKITKADQIDDAYRYNSGPLLLFALQQTVGEQKMRMFMRGLLAAPNTETWEDIKAVALRSGITEDEWRSWQERCVDGAVAKCIAGDHP
jgi:hypothetical protein